MKNFYAYAFSIMAVLLLLNVVQGRAASVAAEQSKQTFKGIVIGSDDNGPLAGVVIYDKNNKKNLTTSDANGEYTISVPASTKTIVFEMMGYDTKEIAVENSFLFTLVTMIVQKSALEGVIVVGFGTQKKESVVGAVQAIKPDHLVTTSSNLITSFEGNIPGLIATQTTGEPGYEIGRAHV